ncbi:MAG: hypothetical protein ACWA5K_02880, partial [bacterium]
TWIWPKDADDLRYGLLFRKGPDDIEPTYWGELTSEQSTFTDTRVEADVIYDYHIQGVDSRDNLGRKSNVVSLQLKDEESAKRE